jgi:hypothetical protein
MTVDNKENEAAISKQVYVFSKGPRHGTTDR